MVVQFSKLLPTRQAYARAGFPSVGAFAVYRTRYPDLFKPIKIGNNNFYTTGNLAAVKRHRAVKRNRSPGSEKLSKVKADHYA